MNIEELVAKWESTRLLENVYSKENMAMCLEAQRIFNEEHDTPPAFKRCSIPLVFRIFIAEGRNRFVNYFDKGAEPQVHYLKAKFQSDVYEPSDSHMHTSLARNLDREAEQTAALAGVVRNEIEEFFKDRFENTIQFHGFGCDEQGNVTLFWS